ncbi:MAG: tyrosine-type recombinase/integrase [Ghiorsea sp.]
MGAAVVKLPAVKKSIRLSFQYRGMQCKETVKLAPSKNNLRYVARLKAEIDRKIELGNFVYGDYFPDSNTKTAKLFTPARQTTTISAALATYIASISRTLSDTTFREYTSSIKRINGGIGTLSIEAITATIIREWIYSLECSPKRINNILVPLRGMFKDLFADGVIEKNPMERVKNLKITKHDPEPLSQDELSRLLAVLEPMAANLITFAAWTGLRTGELLAVTWGDIDLKAKTCRVNKSISRGVLKDSPKTSSGFRTIEMLPKAIEALQDQKQYSFLAGNQVFLQDDMTPFTNDDQLRKRIWLKAIRKSGVAYRPPYQLRHTYASTMLSAGANPMWVAQQMGHSDWGMIRKIYGKWIQQETSEAERMAAILNQKSENISQSTDTRNTKGA